MISSIHTARLELIPGTLDLARAELCGRDAFQTALGVQIPPRWPPDLYDDTVIRTGIRMIEERLTDGGWGVYYFVRKPAGPDPAILIGAGGYKGRPTRDGVVEIGYSIVSAFQRHGYATEAAAGLVAHAFAQPGVSRVIAETATGLVSSIGVLAKCGFRLVGAGSEEGTVRYEVRPHRWRSVL